MPSPTFFLSYARDDNELDDQEASTLVRACFERLRSEIRQLSGDRPEADGSFIDDKIPFGALWKDHLHDAVRRSEVFVPLMSPSYFRREWCGREWAIFERRLASPASAVRIVPVIWVPSAVPAVAGKYQRAFDDQNRAELREAFDDYTTNGLLWLVRYREHAQYQVKYGIVVRALARRIVDAMASPPLAVLDHDAAAQTPTAFAAPVAPKPVALAKLDGDDDSCAYFVAVVGRREQITRDEIRERYADSRWGWKPFVPAAADRLGLTLAITATQCRLMPKTVDFEDDLPAFIRAAEARGRIVVVIVDAWSTELAEYLDRARQLDEHLFDNCAIIVIWSDSPDCAPALALRVRNEAVRRHLNKGLVDEVYDHAGLTTRLASSLRALDEKLAASRTPTRPLPPGESGRMPTVSGTFRAQRSEP